MHLRQDRLFLKLWPSVCFLFAILSTLGQEFQISSIEAEGDLLKLQYPAQPSSYYILYEGDIQDISTPKRLQIGTVGTNQFTNPLLGGAAGTRFYMVRQVERSEPIDIDGDGIDDIYELERDPVLNPLDPADAEKDSDGDGRSNREEYENFDDPEVPSATGLELAAAKSVFLTVPLVTAGVSKDTLGRTLENVTGPPSINDNGTIAFIGEVKYPDGSFRQNIYTLRSGETAPLPLMIERLEWSKSASPANAPFEPWQTFQGPIINNGGTVLSVRHLQTRANLVDFGLNVIQHYPLLSYVEKWDGTTTRGKTQELVDSGDPVNVGAMYWFSTLGIFTFKQPSDAGEAPSVLPFSSAWGDGIRTRPFGFNNSGQSAYITRHSGQPYLASSLAREPLTAKKIPSSARYPDMADDGTVVMNFENEITVFSADLSEMKVLSEIGFSKSGEFPAISDDGRIVAFIGELTFSGGDTLGITPGPGVFAAIKRGTASVAISGWEIIRVAGLSGNGHLDPGETASTGGSTDEGVVGGFDLTWNVGVGNEGVVAYIARDLQGNKALFSSRVAIDRQNFQKCDGDIKVSIEAPQKIASAGSTISGTAITVSDLGVFDPIDNHSMPTIAFWAKDTSGTAHILGSTELLKVRSEDRLVSASINYDTIQRLYPDAKVAIKFERTDGSDEAYGPYLLPAPNEEQPQAYAYANTEQILSDEDPHLRDTTQQIVVLRGATRGDLHSFALFNKPGAIKVKLEIANETTRVPIEQSHTLIHQPQVSALFDSFDARLGTLNVGTGLQPPLDSFKHRILVAKIGAVLFDSLKPKAATYLGNVDGFWEGLKGDAESIGSIAEGVNAVTKDPFGSALAIVELCRQFQPECIDLPFIISKLGREIQEGVDSRLEWARLQGGQIVHDAYIEGFMAGYLTEQWVAGALTGGIGKGILKGVELAKTAKALTPVFGAMDKARQAVNSARFGLSQFIARSRLPGTLLRLKSELGAVIPGGVSTYAAELIESFPFRKDRLLVADFNKIDEVIASYAPDVAAQTRARVGRLANRLTDDVSSKALSAFAQAAGRFVGFKAQRLGVDPLEDLFISLKADTLSGRACLRETLEHYADDVAAGVVSPNGLRVSSRVSEVYTDLYQYADPGQFTHMRIENGHPIVDPRLTGKHYLGPTRFDDVRDVANAYQLPDGNGPETGRYRFRVKTQGIRETLHIPNGQDLSLRPAPPTDTGIIEPIVRQNRKFGVGGEPQFVTVSELVVEDVFDTLAKRYLSLGEIAGLISSAQRIP